jgi:hypothetical protein
MRRSQQLREAYRIPTPYEMHVKHGMALSPEMIAKGRKAIEAKSPRLFISREGEKWRLEHRYLGNRAQVFVSDAKKPAYKEALKVLGRLRDYGDFFVVSDGQQTWRVLPGDTLAFAKAQRGVKEFFKRG